VAHDIVYASLSNGVLTLKDILGSATSVDDAVVLEIDVTKESIGLKKDPLIGGMLRFLEEVSRCERSGRYESTIEDIWLNLKSRGDEKVRELWRRYEDRKAEKTVR